MRELAARSLKIAAALGALVTIGFALLIWRFNQWPIDVSKLDRLIAGMSKAEVTAVIGEPSNPGERHWVYGQWGSWPNVHVYFDGDGRYLRSELDY